MSSYRVSVPGSIMLMGEHAVMRGYPALVTAINREMVLSLETRSDRLIKIESELGQFEASLDKFLIPELSFVSQIIINYSSLLSYGFNLAIESKMPSDKGYGSSAAVSAGLVALLEMLITQQEILDKEKIYKNAFNAICQVQGSGSGSDLVASIYGGILKYCPKPYVFEKIESNLEIVLVNSGKKVPTPEVISIVNKKREINRDINEKLETLIGDTVEKAFDNLKNKDMNSFF